MDTVNQTDRGERMLRFQALWRRAAFLMQPPLAGTLQSSPFANVSVPSGSMVGYAGFYLLVTLALAIRHFQRRDL